MPVTALSSLRPIRMYRRQDAGRNSAIKVPAGTWHIGQSLSRDHYGYGLRLFAFIGRVLAISVWRCRRMSPCGRPEMNRAMTSMAALAENAENRLPTKAINHEHNNEILWWHLRPNTRINVPKHADGIRGNIVAGGGDVYAGGGCGLRQNAASSRTRRRRE